jgi:hypothetical protein
MRKRSFSLAVATLAASVASLVPVTAQAAGARALRDPFAAMIIPGRTFGPPGTIATATTGNGTIFLARDRMLILAGDRVGSLRFAGAKQPEVRFGPSLGPSLSLYAGCTGAKWFPTLDLRASVRLEGLYPGIDFVLSSGTGGRINSVLETTSRVDLSRVKLVPTSTPSVEDGDLILGSAADALHIRPPSVSGRAIEGIAWRSNTTSAALAPAGTMIGAARRIGIPLLYRLFGQGLGSIEWRRLVGTTDGFAGAGTLRIDHGDFLYRALGVDSTLAAVARFDARGNPTGLSIIGGPGNLGVEALAADPGGGVIVGGGTFASCFPEALRGLPAQVGNRNAYALRLASDGVLEWADAFGGGGQVRGAAVADDGTVALVGDMMSSLPLKDPVFEVPEGGPPAYHAFLVRRSADGRVLDASIVPGLNSLIATGWSDEGFSMAGTYTDPSRVATGRRSMGAPTRTPNLGFAGFGRLVVHEIGTRARYVGLTRFLDRDPTVLHEVAFDGSGALVTATALPVDVNSQVSRFDRDRVAPAWSAVVGPVTHTISNLAFASDGAVWAWVMPLMIGTSDSVPLFWGLLRINGSGGVDERFHGSPIGFDPWHTGLATDGSDAVLLGSHRTLASTELKRF